MSSLISSLPIGIKFDPSDEELVCYYLWMKVKGVVLPIDDLITEADVYAHEPWVLHGGHNPHMKNNEQYFFVKREPMSRNGNGKRMRRDFQGDFDGGWWKANTGDKEIQDSQGGLVGYMKTLTFFQYKNKERNRKEATKSDWILHEYRLSSDMFQSNWTLCRLKYGMNKSTRADSPLSQEPSIEAIREREGDDNYWQQHWMRELCA